VVDDYIYTPAVVSFFSGGYWPTLKMIIIHELGIQFLTSIVLLVVRKRNHQKREIGWRPVVICTDYVQYNGNHATGNGL
jgi:hypothetical protein